MSSDVSYPPPDVATLMPRAEAEATIAGFDTRITALEGHKGLALLGTATVGETLVLGVSLGVRRYAVPLAGVAATDRIVAVLTGAPQNGSLQDVYPTTGGGSVNVGVLVPALGINTTVAIPVAFYKVV